MIECSVTKSVNTSTVLYVKTIKWEPNPWNWVFFRINVHEKSEKLINRLSRGKCKWWLWIGDCVYTKSLCVHQMHKIIDVVDKIERINLSYSSTVYVYKTYFKEKHLRQKFPQCVGISISQNSSCHSPNPNLQNYLYNLFS